MKIKNITIKTLLGVALFLLSTLSVHAGFGVSPTDIYNEYLRPGSSFDTEFTLSRSGSLEELDIIIETDLGDIEEWFSFTPGSTFKFEQGQRTRTFTVTVNVPNDAQYTEYDGVIRVKAVPSTQDIKGVSITQGVRLDAGLIVTEVTVRKLAILSINTLDAILGQPVKIEIVGENQGNVDVAPRLKVRVMNLNKELLEEHEITDFGFIDANQTTTLIAEFLTNLPVGEYFIEIQAFLDDEELRKELMVFNIIDPMKAEVKEEKIPLITGIIDWIRTNRTLILFISFALLIALIIEFLTYTLTGKLWEKENFKKHIEKPWAILLGSKKYTRATLSFAIGFIIFLALLLYPVITIDDTSDVDTEIAMGETQGVEDYDFSLTVFPPIEVPRYLIYQEADTNSEIIYKAMEDEEFGVLEETEDWYKVSLEDGGSGWLEKRMVKSENQ